MKIFLIILFLGLIQCSFGQDSIILLNEVTINKSAEKDLEKIIKSIKKNLKKNYQIEQKEFKIKQFSLLNSKDTLISNELTCFFNINSLDNNFSKKETKTKNNYAYKKIDFFDAYEEAKDSPEYWISEVLIRKNLNIVAFDFFNSFQDYKFEIKTEENLVTVCFLSEEMYSGFFTYDKRNYNLHRISFSSSQPYPFIVSNNDNGQKRGLKSWTYTIENTIIDFTENSQKQISLKSIISTEEIKDYSSIKYDKNGKEIRKDGIYSFHSFLKMEAVQ